MFQTTDRELESGLVRQSQSIPAFVGAWELVKLIGEGSLGEVYQARPVHAAKGSAASHAGKVLRKRWADDPRGLEIFARDARIGRRANHPHIVPILAANLDEPPYFLVMPLLE